MKRNFGSTPLPILNKRLTMTSTDPFAKAGYRLHRLEVLNWGTFNQKVWHIEPNGDNALLTGDIGAGKSTLVDALTTLLVRNDRITYNKAAGSDKRERTLKSYVLGAFKGEKLETSHKSKAVYLREPGTTHTVLLAYFTNQNTNQVVTLAQVFWLADVTDSPHKFFVVSERELTVKQHFVGFDSIRDLKRRLREQKEWVYDTFEDYSTRFRALLGIRSEEALDLFYQTISMKQVANLTDFVRAQMLAKTDIDQTIETVIRRFDDLNAAYEAVQQAQRQLLLLEPITSRWQTYKQQEAAIADLAQIADELPLFFAYHKAQLYREELDACDTYYGIEAGKRDELEREVDDTTARLNDLRIARETSSVGQRLKAIAQEIDSKNDVRAKRTANAKQSRELCTLLDLATALDVATFTVNLRQLNQVAEQLDKHRVVVQQERDRLMQHLWQLADDRNELQTEIVSLKQRKTQIPDRWLTIRRRIAEAASLTETDLPFAGELIRVKPTETAWEGAIERRLRGLGLSLLVHDTDYSRVADAVERITLGERVVYYRTIGHDYRSIDRLSAQSLVNKVDIKDDSPFFDWLDTQLRQEHNLICCESVDEFRRTPYAMTRNGQVKMGKMRHEKDDRRDLTNRRDYVLGWSNEQKINALTRQLAELDAQLGRTKTQFDEHERVLKQIDGQSRAIDELRKQRDFADLDWPHTAAEIEQLETERQTLTGQSSELSRLEEAIQQTKKTLDLKKEAYKKQAEEVGKLKNQTTTLADKLYNALDTMDVVNQDADLLESFFRSDDDVMEQLPLWLQRLNRLTIPNDQLSSTHKAAIVERLGTADLNAGNIERKEDELRKQLTGKDGEIDKLTGQKERTGQDVVKKMQQYCHAFPVESRDYEASVTPIAARDFEELYQRITDDDLPRHRERFRRELKEGTINSIVHLQMQLGKSEKDVKDKIQKINERLAEITYDTALDTYIQLVPEPVTTADIATFKNDLRNCLSNSYGDTDNYAERKFADVKQILDKLMSQDEVDKRWRDKVTDVRQWYSFGASERYKETHTEKEYYSDSSGKSGGQKEKLAYTILASAISYQYNITWEGAPRTFRLVVIDEAFGRGSKESTRYGLELFGRMNLQLLIVTPGEKVNIIQQIRSACALCG
ncbi:ATP-binding protein [Spirosoma pollinicola]|uniref:ATP-binding protein n=1 Tax=Spirosoma pollinicola TaxID=2057025 RepID=UPI0014766600|nr:SbcC/MukB-like Walker B domain-containing protein [Spirosoma pollinicola]